MVAPGHASGREREDREAAGKRVEHLGGPFSMLAAVPFFPFRFVDVRY
jgi:hypothetical protein